MLSEELKYQIAREVMREQSMLVDETMIEIYDLYFQGEEYDIEAYLKSHVIEHSHTSMDIKVEIEVSVRQFDMKAEGYTDISTFNFNARKYLLISESNSDLEIDIENE